MIYVKHFYTDDFSREKEEKKKQKRFFDFLKYS